MNTAVRKESMRARSGQSASRVLFVVASFAALLAVAATVGYGLIAPEKPAPADRYRGFVQSAPDAHGQCERFDFDNRTGAMRRQATTWCSAETSTAPPPVGSFGTLGGVRDYFRSR